MITLWGHTVTVSVSQVRTPAGPGRNWLTICALPVFPACIVHCTLGRPPPGWAGALHRYSGQISTAGIYQVSQPQPTTTTITSLNLLLGKQENKRERLDWAGPIFSINLLFALRRGFIEIPAQAGAVTRRSNTPSLRCLLAANIILCKSKVEVWTLDSGSAAVRS